MAILLKTLLNEGVFDRGVLKCVFTAGGPGSGKSFIIDQIFGLPKRSSLTGMGLKVINSDHAFEAFLQKNGINPKDLGKIRDEDPEFYSSVIDTGRDKTGPGIRQTAFRMVSATRKMYMEGRLGMILDSTGADPSYIAGRKSEVEAAGYDAAMVFVNTTLEVALKRNSERERSISNELVEGLWNKCQSALGEYRTIFGNRLYIVENSESSNPDSDVKRAVRRFVDTPVVNPVGKKWMETALILRKNR